ncbi:MAG: hypothetical protein Alpg2KO_27340 [Alphaproteobacteria bacterium]
MTQQMHEPGRAEALDRAELFIRLDTLTACPGNCPGCALSQAERRADMPSLPMRRLDEIYRLAERHARAMVPHSVVITHGIGDHLMLPTEQVQRLLQRAEQFVLSIPGIDVTSSLIQFSTSLIGREKHTAARLQRIAKARGQVPVVPLVVVDPLKIVHEGYGPVYKRLVALARDLFGKADAGINLSLPAIEAMPAEQFHDLLAEYGYSEVELVWAPTDDSLDRTATGLDRLAEWVTAFHIRAEQQGVLYSSTSDLADHARMIWSRPPMPLPAQVREAAATSMRRYLRFDETGELQPDFPATAAIFHSSRFGLKGAGRIDGIEDLAQLAATTEPKLAAHILKTHMRSPACADCPHLPVCATTGFHILNNVLSDGGMTADAGCPNRVARALFDRIAEDWQTDRQQSTA